MTKSEMIEQKIASENAKIVNYEAKIAEYQEKIADARKRIANLNAESQAADLNTLGKLAAQYNIPIKDVTEAFRTGDLFGLMARIEEVKKSKAENQAEPETTDAPAPDEQTF